MAKIDLDSLSIEELAALRDNATDKLAEKVAARHAELEAELERLSQYGKPAKKSLAAPARESQEERRDAGKATRPRNRSPRRRSPRRRKGGARSRRRRSTGQVDVAIRPAVL